MNGTAEGLARCLGLGIDTWPAPDAVRPLVNFVATARNSEGFIGFGAGATEDEARIRATMECVERRTQFSTRPPSIACVAPYADVAALAVSPLDFGLYRPAQYRLPGFGMAPFRERVPLEWVQARDLLDDSVRLVPVEFIYPRAPLARPPIVAETSNGTAAHHTVEAAILGGVCEVIERDGLLLFWYRQPRTPTVDVSTMDQPSSELIEGLRRGGWVVSVCDIGYDLPVPRFLAVALRGRNFGYGLGCHLDAGSALRHALRELATRLASFDERARVELVHRPLHTVAGPSEHFELYDAGPLHDVLRRQLASALLPPGEGSTGDGTADTKPGDTSGHALTLRSLLESLAARGIRAYVHDLTHPDLTVCGVSVVRVLVPGLVPMHFGYDRIRLGCERLTDSDAPGRLSTLLPHFAA